MTDAWTPLTAALATELARLPEGAVLIVVKRGHPREFVQFAQAAARLRAEAAGRPDGGSNGGSEPVRRLLEALGWQPSGPGDHNWWQTLPWPATTAEYAQLADAATAVLREINGVQAPTDLVYKAWTSDNRPRRAELPGVGTDA